jgi:hypothetical protein
MQKHDNPYNIFPKDKYSVKMVHLFPGKKVVINGVEKTLRKKDCHNSKYYSILTVVPKNTDGSLELDHGFAVTAKCGPGDSPSREKAREVLRLKAREIASYWGWVK